MKQLVTVLILAAAASIPFTANAAPDEAQRMMIQNIQAAKQALAEAETAQGAERQKMMQRRLWMAPCRSCGVFALGIAHAANRLPCGFFEICIEAR